MDRDESYVSKVFNGKELMMKVSDKELEAFSIQQRHIKLLQAREQGKKALAQ